MTTREAELELEIARLRDALEKIQLQEADNGCILSAGDCVSIADDALSSAPPSTMALKELIEKVEKLTIERCANDIESFANLAFNTGYKIARLDCAAVIRKLPTGQINLEELK